MEENEKDCIPGRSFDRPVSKRELARAIPCSITTLNRYIATGRIAPPALRFSQRLLLYIPRQANDILAGGTGEATEEEKRSWGVVPLQVKQKESSASDVPPTQVKQNDSSKADVLPLFPDHNQTSQNKDA